MLSARADTQAQIKLWSFRKTFCLLESFLFNRFKIHYFGVLWLVAQKFQSSSASPAEPLLLWPWPWVRTTLCINVNHSPCGLTCWSDWLITDCIVSKLPFISSGCSSKQRWWIQQMNLSVARTIKPVKLSRNHQIYKWYWQQKFRKLSFACLCEFKFVQIDQILSNYGFTL